MKLRDFMADEKLVSEYHSWISSDIGIVVCGVLKDTFCRPVLPGQVGEQVNRSTAELCLGENVGAWKMLEALQNLDENEALKAADMINETYMDVPMDNANVEEETAGGK